MIFLVFLFACNDAPPSPSDNIIAEMNFTQFTVDCGNITINMHIKKGYRYSGGEDDSDYYTDRNWSLTQDINLNDSNVTKSVDNYKYEWSWNTSSSNPVSSSSMGKLGKLMFSDDYSMLDTVSFSFSSSSSSHLKPNSSSGNHLESVVLINVPFTYENDELVIDLNGSDLTERLVGVISNSSSYSSNYFEGSSSYDSRESVAIVNLPDSAYLRIRYY